MNELRVIGIKKSSFTAKDTGELIEGCNIWLSYESKNIEGIGVDRIFLTQSKLANCGWIPKVGDTVSLRYNRYGKVEDVECVA